MSVDAFVRFVWSWVLVSGSILAYIVESWSDQSDMFPGLIQISSCDIQQALTRAPSIALLHRHTSTPLKENNYDQKKNRLIDWYDTDPCQRWCQSDLVCPPFWFSALLRYISSLISCSVWVSCTSMLWLCPDFILHTEGTEPLVRLF